MALGRSLILSALLILLSYAAVPAAGTGPHVPPVRSTFLGGSDHDEGYSIDVGPDGRVYVAGATTSRDFPGSPNADLSANAFVARLSSDLSRVEWARVLGGTSHDVANAVRVSGDSVYVAGQTESLNFPTSGGIVFDPSYGGNSDGFLTALTLDGAVRWSTYVGGAGFDAVEDLDLDPDGRPVLAGTTLSCDFPTNELSYRRPAADCAGTFSGDGFLIRFWTDGALHRSTLFGGSENDRTFALAVSPTSGSLLFTGVTTSTDLPVAADAAQSRPDDVFVASINADMTALSYATYLGGSDQDWAWDVARDAQGNAYVTGYTYSSDFPTTANALQRTHASLTGCSDGPDTFNAPCQDAYVAKITPTGTALTWSTFLGGDGNDEGFALAVDTAGRVHVVGGSQSGDSFLPARAGERGFADAFVASIHQNGTHLLAVRGLGGSNWEEGFGVDLGGDRMWLTGFTWSSDFPTTEGAHDRTLGGIADAFVSNFEIPTTPPPPPELLFDHRGGNEWWVEVVVTGAQVTAVEAMDTSGPWVPLAKKSWGPWAASFHIEPGHQVRFRAQAEGVWSESCWFTHPGGLEQCDGPGPGGFTATFSQVKGNEWWIEARVTANQPPAKVEVSLNGGAPRPLELRNWGSWAASHHAPSGTIVRFIATSTAGGAPVLSGCYRWTAADPVPCPAAPLAPVFDHKSGNEWWVEVTVSGPTPTRVQSRDTDGPWVDITLRSWGAWAGSYHIEPGHDVRFRALVDNAWYESCWFSHPAGAPRTGGTTCTGVRA